MRWSVEGANEETGEEMAVVVEAATRVVAESEARRRGVLVASITSLETLSPADEVSIAYQARQTQTSPAIAYQSPGAAHRAPTYLGLRIAAGILSIIAMLYYAAGLLVLGFTIYYGLRSPLFSFGLEGLFYLLGPMFVLLAIGGICQGFSAACLALRDIATNSFRPRG